MTCDFREESESCLAEAAEMGLGNIPACEKYLKKDCNGEVFGCRMRGVFQSHFEGTCDEVRAWGRAEAEKLRCPDYQAEGNCLAGVAPHIKGATACTYLATRDCNGQMHACRAWIDVDGKPDPALQDADCYQLAH